MLSISALQADRQAVLLFGLKMNKNAEGTDEALLRSAIEYRLAGRVCRERQAGQPGQRGSPERDADGRDSVGWRAIGGRFRWKTLMTRLTGPWAHMYNGDQHRVMAQKPLKDKELEALRIIRDRIAHGERPPSIRELADTMGYSSPNAAAYVLLRLIEAGYVQRRNNGRLQVLREPPIDPGQAHTVKIPLVGTAPCGGPLLAEENVEAWIDVSDRLARPPHRYFLLRAVGTSMDRAGIQDGDLVLVRQQPTADSGDRVVALIDDSATIKILRHAGDVVMLEPKSTETKHKPIILSNDFQVQGVVQATISAGRKDEHDG